MLTLNLEIRYRGHKRVMHHNAHKDILHDPSVSNAYSGDYHTHFTNVHNFMFELIVTEVNS